MSIKTARWNDPIDPNGGQRLLICRLRPRGVRREDEPWDAWVKELAPSKPLLDAFHGKHAPPIPWDEYERRYLDEMREQRYRIEGLAGQVAAGKAITLLCSSACTDPARCHRTLLAGLIEEAAARR
jgi:uncharacterized protein YeaO (DUF488 family)